MNKKITLLILLAVLHFTAKAIYQIVPLNLSSFNSDVVANGIGPSGASSTGPLDAVNYVFAAQDYQYSGACALPAAPNYLPTGGLITNLLGTGPAQYQLADYSGPNCLHLTATAPSGTLSFQTPVSAGEIYLLANTGSGVGNADIIITFTDASTQIVNGLAIADWYGGANVVIKAARVATTTAACGVEVGTSPSGPNLYQYLIAVNPANFSKQIASITINRLTSSTGLINLMAISINTPCPTPVDQATTLNLVPGTSQISGTFNGAPSVPAGYLVVRYPSGAIPVDPAHGTNYAAGAPLGTGSVVYSGVNTNFTATGLFASTLYDFYIYSYNSGSCVGPVYNTVNPLSGTISTSACGGPGNVTIPVGPGQTYVTLTDAITGLSGTGISGPVIVELQSNYNGAAEPGYPVVFPFNPCVSPANTLTVRPAPGAFGLAISSSNAGPTIDFNGSSNIILDGRPGGFGTANLQIINTSTAGAAVRFINDASNNYLIFCDVQGQNTSATSSALSGVIYFGTASVTGQLGNDNNIISGCSIHGTSTGNPAIGIASYGTTTTAVTYNDNGLISDNYIFDFFSPTVASTGIKLDLGNSAWGVNNNSIFQTADRTYTTAATHRGIWITPNSGALAPQASGFVVSGNFIGGTSPFATGTPYTMLGNIGNVFNGMDISVGYGIPTLVTNNTIQNISLVSTSTANIFVGLGQANGHVDFMSNIIGDPNINNSISITKPSATGGTIFGIRAGGGTNATINIIGNTIAGITGTGTATVAVNLIGIAGAGGTNINVINNIVGSTSLPNSINLASSTTGAQQLTGILISAGTTSTVTGNIISNLNNNYISTATTGQVRGIAVTAGLTTISDNTISDLYTTSTSVNSGASGSVIGIAMTSTTAGYTINHNTIYNLRNTATAAATNVAGMFISGATSGSNTISRNFIYRLSAATTSAAAFVSGVDIGAGFINMINNMLSLGYDHSGASITTPLTLRGITRGSTATASNFYHNSVYMGGDNVLITGTSNSFAFQRNSVPAAGADNIQNNIFVNARSNAGAGGGKHYAVYLNTNANNLTLNYNIYNTTGVNGVMGYTGAADAALFTPNWIPNDINSLQGDPQFADPAGTFGIPDLHINPLAATPVEGTGLLIPAIMEDFDGDIRASNTPTDRGADAGNFVAIPFITVSSVTPFPSGFQCTPTARLITATVTAGALPVSGVTLNFAFNGVAQSAVTMSFSGGSVSGISTWTGTIPATPTPNVNVTWTVNATDGSYFGSLPGPGYMDIIPDIPSITPVSSSICEGNMVALSVAPVNAVFGTGTLINTLTTWPAPFSNWYGGNKHQMLILASELSAAGLNAGSSINSIAFNVQTLGTNFIANPNLTQFQINMGHTPQAALNTTFIPTASLQTVRPAATLAITTGVNVINLPVSFTWNGTDNIVVQTAFTKSNTGATQDGVIMFQTATTFASTAYACTDGVAAVATFLNYAATTSGTVNGVINQRLNMILGVSGVTGAVWVNLTGLYNDAALTIPVTPSDTSNTVYASPSSSQSYTAYGYKSGCLSLAPSVPVSVNVTPVTALAVTGTSSSYVHIDGSTHYYTDPSCNLIATVEEPAGGNVLGNVTASVTIDGSVQSANGQPYHQRHYDITPTSNGTATVTLYVTQGEFDAYNLSAGSYPLMPVNTADVINAANVRVTKFTGAPFTAGNGTLLTPISTTYNASKGWWEIKVNITGFSSFYIHTGTAAPLQITLRDIAAVNMGSRNRVNWSTVSETKGVIYELERSTDGNHFSYLGSMNGKGEAAQYSFMDEAPFTGINYYRLKIKETSGSSSYSKVVNAIVKSSNAFVAEAFPNPVKDLVTVIISGTQGANATISLTDISGRVLRSNTMNGNTITLDMSRLAAGVYMLKYTDANHTEMMKINKQ